jgi:hypothetical protein
LGNSAEAPEKWAAIGIELGLIFSVPQEQRSRMMKLLAPGAAVCSMIAATLIVPLTVISPTSNVVAAVFPPWWISARVFGAAASAGDIIAIGWMPSIVFVRGEPEKLADRLHSAGALLLVASSGGGCSSQPLEISR